MKKLVTIFFHAILCVGVFNAYMFCQGGTLVALKKRAFSSPKPPKKSQRNLGSPRDRQLSLCEKCTLRKLECHDRHEFCIECDKRCKVCDDECAECNIECSICYEVHSEKEKEEDKEEVGLVCNHVFGKKCIEKWQKEYGKNTCPICRAQIEYKASGACAICWEDIHAREPSKWYDCSYYPSFFSFKTTEKHVFHRRCIEKFALLTAYKNKNKDIVFHCPLQHKHSVFDPKDLEVSLSSIVPAHKHKHYEFSPKLKGGCELCHKVIKKDDVVRKYTCEFRDTLTWNKQEHTFHEDCLKPFVERACFKLDNDVRVFYCPAEHCQSITHHEELIVPLSKLPGIEPEYIHYICSICLGKEGEITQEQVDKFKENSKDADIDVLSYTGWPRIGLRIDEKKWYHSKCLNEFILKNKEFSGVNEFKFPCPFHLRKKIKTGIDEVHYYPLAKNKVSIIDDDELL